MSTHSTSYDTQGIPRLPALPTQALRLLKTTHRSPKVTAMGGVHGLYGSLSALRHVTPDLTAVVTVADDGGSSGRLREEMGILPPGDLRMALSALCDDTDWGRTWRDVMQHRFSAPEGYEGEFPLDYHALGNLLIATLWQLLDDPVAYSGLGGCPAECARYVCCRWRWIRWSFTALCCVSITAAVLSV